ncbi:hypothetical protein [Spirosoma oryzicola]|uniref:hypothetical protein n=1 Tax=Spirosoma oryzicola TaxID=2898794 RepID=UPI001E5E9F43|nr:hypothetical protein [Spirosoma oryzicola]UHG90163.1 hypothetical protein LQ777_18150 [Spirosoma oryzicola]
MNYNRAHRFHNWLAVCLLVSSSVFLTNCSGEKKDSTAESKAASTGSDSSVFGRQGDTTNSSMTAPQQAPPDSADARGAVVPAEINVKVKK